ETLKDALIIPQTATFDVLDKKFVYVVNEHDVLESREIVVGTDLPHLYVVTSGLAEGEHILFEGLGRVKNGDKIEPDFLEPSKAIAKLDSKPDGADQSAQKGTSSEPPMMVTSKTTGPAAPEHSASK